MKYSTTLMAAANLMALASAAPAGPGCSLVAVTYTGAPVWVPTPDPGWQSWTSSKKPAATSTDGAVWPAWTNGGANGGNGGKGGNGGNGGWPSPAPTSTSTSTYPGPPNNWNQTSTTYTTPTTIIITTSSSSTITTTSSTSTTTTTTPAAAPTCPSDNGSNVLGGGSCDCQYQLNCGVHADVGASTNFWEQTSGALVNSLEECLAQCDNNSDCTAVIWTNDTTAQASDYLHCWQTSGLGGVVGSGYGQISYRGSCAGSCSSSYNTSG